jgi:hypothetical protein
MNSAHKWLIAGLSLFLIFYSSFVVWYYFEKSSISTSKPNLAQSVSDKMGKVLAGGAPTISVDLKDSSTQGLVDNAVITITTPSIELLDCGGTLTFEASDHSYWGLCNAKVGVPPDVIYITISKDGYETKSTTIPSYSYGRWSGTIYINKVTSISTNTPTTSPTKKTTTTTTKIETIKDVILPSIFTTVGSATTNLTSIADTKNVTNLTFDVVGKSKVVFSDPVDLSSTTARDLFKQLDSYVRMMHSGIVDIDSSVLSILANKKATISLFNLPFVDKPDLLVNGKLATSKIVSNVSYKNKTLTFNVTGFSKYEAVPKLTIIEPANNFTSEKENITLKGKITDPTATVSAQLNGVSLGKLKVATASGEFTANLKLVKGTNNIRVESLSKFGPPLIATVSAVFKPLVSSKIFIVGGIGLALILIVVIVWWYYKKRKSKIISTI